MSVLVAEPVASTARAQPQSASWLVGPWFDLFFVANIAWPLVLLLQWDSDVGAGIHFWQVYFVTAPHRWITLALVFLDRGRFQERRSTFLALALSAVLLCVAVRLTTGTLTCLLALDYLWNAWHFSAQHHGIFRIYARQATPSSSRWLLVEKWGMRIFLLYVILRVATATWADPTLDSRLRLIDFGALLLPIYLMGTVLASRRRQHAGCVAYLASVLLLFAGMLWAVHERRMGLVLTFTTASALFHAIEYLAIVSWSARRRHHSRAGEMGMLAHLVPRWLIALTVFVLVLGVGGYLMDRRGMEIWLLLNVVAAFLHYAYDGLIWRRGGAQS